MAKTPDKPKATRPKAVAPSAYEMMDMSDKAGVIRAKPQPRKKKAGPK